MRTKQEYQDKLNDIENALNRSETISAYWFNDLLKSVAILQELIDNLPDEKVYVEETETIYVDIDKMMEKYREENKNVLPGFVGLDEDGNEQYEPRDNYKEKE